MIDEGGREPGENESGPGVAHEVQEPTVPVEITPVTLENVDQMVNLVIGWLREDFGRDPKRFFGENPVDVDKRPISYSELGRVIDNRFIRLCKSVIRTAIEERSMMKFADESGQDSTELFRRDACVVVVYELFRTFCFHYRHTRQDGTSYAYNHLVGELDPWNPEDVNRMGTMLIGMKILGLCGLTSMVGLYKHDDREDVLGMTEDRLLDVGLYVHRFEDTDPGKIQRLTRRVVELVVGVTKVSGKINQEALEKQHGVKFANSQEATFYQFLVQMQKDIRVAYVRFADRLHNMLTIMGHADELDRRRIAGETVQIFLPLARILKVEDLVKELIDVCAKVLNPNLYNEYYAKLRERVATMDKVKPSILSDIKGCEGVADVKFSPFRLEYYTQRFQSGLERLKISDFRINEADPMQEIVVLVDDPLRIPVVARDVEVALDFMSSDKVSLLRAPSVDSPTHWVRPDGTDVLPTESPALVNESGTVSGQVEEASSFVQRGILVTGFSAKYRKQLKIRVNDVRSEHRMKRGIQANARTTVAPKDMLDDIQYLIDQKRVRPEDNLLTDAREGMLRPKTCFFTPHGDLRMVPAGTCYAEAGCSVHSVMGVGMKGANVSGSLTAGQDTRVASILDPIPFVVPGDQKVPMIVFDSVVIGTRGWRKRRERILDQIDACPGWLIFFKGRKARQKLKDFFAIPYGFLRIEKSASVNDAATKVIGQRYLDKLSKIFGSGVGEFLSKKYSHILPVNICRSVGLGNLDVFSDVVDNLDFSEGSDGKLGKYVMFKVDLAGAQSDEYFSGNFRRIGFEPKYIQNEGDVPGRAQDKSGVSGKVYRVYSVPKAEGADYYELCKVLLKLSYTYDLSILRGVGVKPAKEPEGESKGGI